MGVATIASERDAFRPRDAVVTTAAYAAGVAAAAAAVALAATLLVFGSRALTTALSTPGAARDLAALGITGIIVICAVSICLVVGFLAAACASDSSVGGSAGKTLRESLAWSSGVSPVVIGVIVFFAAIAAGHHDAIPIAIAALVVLNLPNATSRFAYAFEMIPHDVREAAAALGASPAAAFFNVVRPVAPWCVASVLLGLSAQMIGETSAVALVLSASTGAVPLSVQIWRFASNISLAGSEAAACIVLVIVIGAFTALSVLCARRYALSAKQT